MDNDENIATATFMAPSSNVSKLTQNCLRFLKGENFKK
jgi:hypothetical protein